MGCSSSKAQPVAPMVQIETSSKYATEEIAEIETKPVVEASASTTFTETLSGAFSPIPGCGLVSPSLMRYKGI